MRTILAAVFTGVLALFAGSLAGEAWADEPGWSYDSKTDKMTGEITVFGALWSDNKVTVSSSGGEQVNGLLQLRKASKDWPRVLLAIRGSQIDCYPSCRIRIRFDDRKVMEFTGSPPESGPPDAIFIKSEAAFLTFLKKAKTVMIEVPFYREGPQVFSFSSTNYRADLFGF